jgi:hypothetical protein
LRSRPPVASLAWSRRLVPDSSAAGELMVEVMEAPMPSRPCTVSVLALPEPEPQQQPNRIAGEPFGRGHGQHHVERVEVIFGTEPAPENLVRLLDCDGLRQWQL